MPSASIDPITFQPGRWGGAWATPSGSVMIAAVAIAPAAARRGGDDRGGARADPDPDQRRRLELAEAALDEKERRAPDRCQRDQHEDVAPAHASNNVRLRRYLPGLSAVAEQPLHRALGLTDA